VDWLTTDRRFLGEPRFPGLKAIAMVEATVERRGTVTTARRYFLSSLPGVSLLQVRSRASAVLPATPALGTRWRRFRDISA
jgi:hypothetical protein